MSFEFNQSMAYDFARKINTEFFEKGRELFFRKCPYCQGGSHSDRETFSINLENGMFKCFRSSCGKQGNFITLAKDFGIRLFEEQPLTKKNYRRLPQKPIKVRDGAVEYLGKRGISEEIVRKYKITTQENNSNIIVFPFFDWNGELKTVKYRKADFQKGRDKNKEWFEKETMPILFGMKQCEDFETLIITEGQIDSLSVAQAGFKNAVSVPNGARGFTWLDNCFVWVSQFKEIIVFGDCENGKITLVDELSKRLQMNVKCVEVADYLGEKDANDILRKHGEKAVANAIYNAKSVPINRIKKLSEVEAVDIYRMPRISTGFRELDKILGGFYFGQVILLTGERGNGKSTWMSQLICEALKQEIKTLAYSGELPNYHFKRWIDLQLAGPNYIEVDELTGYTAIPKKIIESINSWYDELAYIYDNNSAEINDDEFESLLDTVEKAVCRYGIRFVCIDNLMTALDVDLSQDLYRAQSKFLKRLKNIAVKYDVCVLLVAHPRKLGAGGNIDNNDVAGSGDITNRVDTVLAYRRSNSDSEEWDSSISVTKNRLIGKLATGNNSIKLYYSEKSKRLSSEQSVKRNYSFGWENRESEVEYSADDDLPF